MVLFSAGFCSDQFVWPEFSSAFFLLANLRRCGGYAVLKRQTWRAWRRLRTVTEGIWKPLDEAELLQLLLIFFLVSLLLFFLLSFPQKKKNFFEIALSQVVRESPIGYLVMTNSSKALSYFGTIWLACLLTALWIQLIIHFDWYLLSNIWLSSS